MARTLILLVLVILLLLAATGLVGADGSDGYTLTRWTVDGGGASSRVAGAHTLGGTVGQPDAGVLSNADYVLQGGFWSGDGVPWNYLYLPLTLRNY